MTVPLLKSEISSFCSSSVTVGPSQNPNCWFSHAHAQLLLVLVTIINAANGYHFHMYKQNKNSLCSDYNFLVKTTETAADQNARVSLLVGCGHTRVFRMAL